jgi:hypothetical protein
MSLAVSRIPRLTYDLEHAVKPGRIGTHLTGCKGNADLCLVAASSEDVPEEICASLTRGKPLETENSAHLFIGIASFAMGRQISPSGQYLCKPPVTACLIIGDWSDAAAFPCR